MNNRIKILGLIVFFTAIIALPSIQFEWTHQEFDLSNASSGPSYEYIFGTDNMGRDLWFQILTIILITVFKLWSVVFLACLSGAFLGILLIYSLKASPFIRVFIRTYSSIARVVMFIPITFLVFTLAVFLGAFEDIYLMLVFYFVITISFAHEVYGKYHQDKDLEYWKAHEVLGGRLFDRIWRYGFLGSWTSSFQTNLIFYLQAILIAECSLSYLGFGILEPNPSFGNLLASHSTELLRGDARVSLVTASFMASVLWLPHFLFGSDRNALSSSL